MWYAAHAVMLIRFREGEQNEFPVWENILLVEAPTPEEAKEKACQRALEDVGNDETMTWDKKPAFFEFIGLRKLMQCCSDEEQPGDGTEVSFNDLLFSSRKELDAFVAGEESQVTFQDENPPG